MPLSKIKQMIVPSEGAVLDKLVLQSDLAHQASSELVRLLSDYQDVHAAAKRIKELEQEGDEAAHAVYAELNRTFIVPFDHADVSSLATALDDILDLTNASARFLSVYDIRNPAPTLLILAQVLQKQTLQLQQAVKAIRSPKTFSDAANVCVEINRLENEADDAYAKGLAELFKGKDAVEILRQKTVFDCLEAATDKVERAANVVSDIVMKHS